MQKYFFIPGRNPDLSLTELKSVFSNDPTDSIVADHSGKFFILSSELEVEQVKQVFSKLGGMIKFGEILDENVDLIEITNSEKVLFGLSVYSEDPDIEKIREFARKYRNELKRSLSKSKRRVRFIGSKSTRLSSGQIVGTDLLEKGFELVLLEDREGNIISGKTVAVQDIDALSKRDFEKPFVDTQMGVIPPKLARIMLNLTQLPETSVIWDPFCGSGNIVLEGLLLGYDMVGSDIDEDAVKATKGNLHWLSENFDLGYTKYNLFQLDISNVDKKTQTLLRRSEINALVFEPYMGPPLTRPISKQYGEELSEMVIGLYKELLTLVERINAPGLKIVSVIPSYRTKKGWITLRYTEIFSKKWDLSMNSKMKGLHWERSNSIIRRNLVIAQLKN